MSARVGFSTASWGSVSVPSFMDNFDDERGALANAEIETGIRAALARLLEDG